MPQHRGPHILVLVALFGFLALFAAPARAANGPGGFINELANQVLQTVNDAKLSPSQQEQKLHGIADKGFNVPAIARFVLGTYWRIATPAERSQFTQVFETYMVAVYASRFQQYKSVTFRVTGTMPQGDNQTVVHTEILQPSGRPPAKVDWVVTGKNGDYKIYDVSIEGVSQLLTYRDEFASVINRNGGSVSALIDQLRDKVNG